MADENKVIRSELEWTFKPKDLLEGETKKDINGVKLTIANGMVKASISPEKFDNVNVLKKKLTGFIESKLEAAKLIKHKDFELKGPSRVDVKSNGKKNYYLKLESTHYKIRMGEVDFINRDKDGNVITDTKQDRINKISLFADQIYKHKSDFTLKKLLKSYENAVNDPEDEFIHLFEIIEALKTKFGSKKKVLNRLKDVDDSYDKLGNFANNPNREESRHRGKSQKKLQKSTKSEIKAARKYAVNLIEKYLDYLELS